MGNDLHCLRPKNGARLEPNCFKVRNVNESGHIVNKGYLEVTQTDLILHIVNAEPVKWPLRCLRRYGHDANLFSFESGRRCATGPGIYAFKSKYAIQIFRLVQENAKHTDESSTSPTSPTPNNVNSRSNLRQHSPSSDTAPPPSQTLSHASSSASGMNGALPTVANGTGSISPHPSVSSNLSYPPPTSPTPLYFNGNGSIGSLRMSPISPTIQYVNTSPFGEIPESSLETAPDDALANGIISEEPSGHDASLESFGDPDLNYARLKLPTDEDNITDHVRKYSDVESVSGAEAKPEGHVGSAEDKEEARVGMDEGEVGGGLSGMNNDESGIGADLENSDGNRSEDRVSSLGCESGIVEGEIENKPGKRTISKEEEGKDLSVVNDLIVMDDGSPAKSKSSGDVARGLADVDPVDDEEKNKSDVKLKVKKKGKREVSDIERTALLQDVANGNIRPEKIKDRNMDAESKLNILVNYANLTEQQIQDVLQKLEMNRNDNISPCTVCSTSSSNASQRVSPLSYYANLDTAGELPPNWQPNGFQFYPELRTPRSTSSKGSTGSEFTFDVNRGSCSPVDHNYANLDTLPEVQPLRHSLSSGGTANGAGNWMILQPPPKGKVNYIQLEFDENDQPIIQNTRVLRRSMSSSASTTPPKTPLSPPSEIAPTAAGAKTDIYARIDIEKTVALANSHRQVEGDTDISTRRTRHDVWTENKAR